MRKRKGCGREDLQKRNLIHFSFKLRHLVATILTTFSRIYLPNSVQFEQY